MMKPIVILTGPTAVGKTALSIALAKAIHGEIISADSMQVYKKMNIGTAKVTKEEMQGIPHYLIDELDPKDEFNVVKFKELGKEYMKQIYKKGKIPIVVGGTGFYIQALLYDIQFDENKDDKEYRTYLEGLLKEEGELYLHQLLKNIDIESAKLIHPNNVKRVIRALEFYHQTGKRISEHNEEESQRTSPYQFVYFVLTDKREILYDRINKRVDKMIEDGLVNEVRTLYKEGYEKKLVSMQGIGYKEIIEYLEGNVSLEEAIANLKKDTRHFAKRQLTWFRREKEVTWIDKEVFSREEGKILEYLFNVLKEKGIITNVYDEWSE